MSNKRCICGGLGCRICGGLGYIGLYGPTATPEEIKIYQFRATEYADLATYLRRISSDLLDKQVISTAETFANECDALAKQWAKEWRGGL